MLRIAATRRNGAILAKRGVNTSAGTKVTPPPVPPVVKQQPKSTPPPKPKKKFSLFGFLLKTALIGGTAYGATLWVATKNPKVMDFVVENDLPFSEELIDYIETTHWQDIVDLFYNTRNQLGNIELPTLENIQDIRAKLEEKALSAKKKIDTVTHPMPHDELQKVEIGPVTRNIKRLPLVDATVVSDPEVKQLVQSLNELIGLVDASNIDSKLVNTISADVTGLSSKISTLTGLFNQSVKDQLAVLQKELLSSSTKKELETTQNLLEQYNREKDNLEQKLKQQLQNEVEATKNTIAQAAVNAVTMVRINQTKEFTELVTAKVDAERDGRLANLEKLNHRVEELEQFAQGLEAQVIHNQQRHQLHKAVVDLRTLLFEYPELQPAKMLTPAVNTLIALSNQVNDPVLEEAIRNLVPLIDHDLTHSLFSNLQLLARWEQLAPELRLASLLPPNAGLLGHLSSLVFSKLLIPVKGDNPGANDIELVIARVEDSLVHGNLDDAVEEVAGLKGWPRKLADDWVQQGRKTLTVEFLMQLIDTESRVV